MNHRSFRWNPAIVGLSLAMAGCGQAPTPTSPHAPDAHLTASHGRETPGRASTPASFRIQVRRPSGDDVGGLPLDLAKATLSNSCFRKELATTRHAQIVLMSLKPGEEIGREVHEHDQILVFVSGEGEYLLRETRGRLKAGGALVVSAGTPHNVINTGSVPLKLYTVYAPPEHAPGTVHRTKIEAEAAEALKHARP